MEKDQKQTKENYEHLKALFSYGDITKIKNNTGFSRGTIYNVLNGRSKNDQILLEIVKILGKLPPKLKRFEIESVKQKLYEKFKIYGVTNRCDFKTSRRWHVGQRDLSSTRHQPADIF